MSMKSTYKIENCKEMGNRGGWTCIRSTNRVEAEYFSSRPEVWMHVDGSGGRAVVFVL